MVLLPSPSLMHLSGSNDMLQFLETVGPAITNSAIEGFSMPTNLVQGFLNFILPQCFHLILFSDHIQNM